MLLWFALMACSEGRFEGRVVDGLTGEPLADFALMAKATEATSMGCTAFSIRTDAEGKFSATGRCAVPYALTPVKSDVVDVWFASGDAIAADPAAPVEVQAWKTPTAPGVYRFSAGEFEPMRTVSDLKARDLSGSTEKVKFPAKLPDIIVLLPAEDRLVLVGKDNVEGLAPAPLIASPNVVIRERGADVTQKNWFYLGVRVTPGPPPAVERVGARFDPAKVKSISRGDRTVAFIQGDALPPGRYGLSKAGDNRIYVLDFGVAQATGGEAPAPEPADAGGPVEGPG